MFKIIVPMFLLLALVCTGIKTEEKISSTEPLSQYYAVKAFHYFDDYLGEKDPKGDETLAVAKKLMTNGDRETYTQRAAKIYAYLNEFDQCEPKAIEYMRDALRALEDSLPQFMQGEEPQTRMEKLLVDSLKRASEKCKSFIETMFKEAESKVNPDSKKVLYEFLTHDMVKPGDSLSDRVAENALKDENLSKQLSDYSKFELHEFFLDKFTENLVKPCENYRDVMSPFMEATRGLVHSEMKSILFDEPSTDLLDARARFALCDVFGEGDVPVAANWFADQCVTRFQQLKV